ncbi:MAG: FeoB-associated Cys-rich membrane protein [Treponema sp.]|nr:FeoB-associated Cys-rich membrane protein [Treponema sp.]
MDFIQDNLSTIIAGTLVFGLLGFVLFRLIRKARRGESACSCGCSRASGCPQSNPAARRHNSPSRGKS